MDPLLLVATILILAIGVAHSYLGEKYILIRLFRRDNLPRLFGDDRFTKRTLRWTWHVTSLAWWGLGAVVVAVASAPEAQVESLVLRSISIVFAAHTLVALLASRGRHLSWIVFGAISALIWLATG